MDDYPAHFAEPRGAVSAGVVGHGLHVDEDVARDDARSPPVAVIEGDDIGEVVVSEVSAVHLQQPCGRAEDVVHVAQHISFRFGHFAQPPGRQALLREPVRAVVGIVAYSHSYLFFMRFLPVPRGSGIPSLLRREPPYADSGSAPDSGCGTETGQPSSPARGSAGEGRTLSCRRLRPCEASVRPRRGPGNCPASAFSSFRKSRLSALPEARLSGLSQRPGRPKRRPHSASGSRRRGVFAPRSVAGGGLPYFLKQFAADIVCFGSGG